MKAENGRTYAQIVGGKCHLTFTVSELPEWADATEQPGNPYTIYAVDVTGTVPNAGDLWDGVKFTAPPAPPVLAPADRPVTASDVLAALIAKGVITQADVNTAAAAKPVIKVKA